MEYHQEVSLLALKGTVSAAGYAEAQNSGLHMYMYACLIKAAWRRLFLNEGKVRGENLCKLCPWTLLSLRHSQVKFALAKRQNHGILCNI